MSEYSWETSCIGCGGHAHAYIMLRGPNGISVHVDCKNKGHDIFKTADRRLIFTKSVTFFVPKDAGGMLCFPIAYKQVAQDYGDNSKKIQTQPLEYTVIGWMPRKVSRGRRGGGGRIPAKYSTNQDAYEARIHTSERSYNSQGRSKFSYRWKRYRL